MTLLAKDVHVRYRVAGRTVNAVNGVSLELSKGQRVGLIGESGCGKSSLFRALLGLEPLASGQVTWAGQPTHSASAALRRAFQPVFQDVGAALNPRMRIRTILEEPFVIHGRPVSPATLSALLQRVRVDESVLERLPRELSVGQRQRINLARALALEPDVLLLDEPVSALDVSVQAEVINLLNELAGPGLLVISHDLEVIAHLTRHVLVMFAGRIVEEGATAAVLSSPRHPYTRFLVESRTRAVAEATARIADVGCPFAPRCPDARLECASSIPPLTGTSHRSACFVHLGT